MRLRMWVLAVSLAWPLAAAAKQPPSELADLVEKLLPAVVNIINVSYVPIDDKQPATSQILKKKLTYGSGFIITPDGLIATNKHVTAHGSEYFVTFANGKRLRADLIGEAVGIDLALLKARTTEKLPTVKLGNSDDVRRGDAVIAIGNPLGYASSVSTGIISALDRDLKMSRIDHFFQTDAEINQGNSGGPLFNAAGEVIGINTAILTVAGSSGSVGIGFAIPIEDGEVLLESIKKHGRPRPAFLGADVQQLDGDLADSLNLAVPNGSLVTGIAPDSPAAKAGLRQGDLILGFDGVVAPNARALYRAIIERPFDAKVVVDLVRDGAMMHVPATLSEYPRSFSLDVHAVESPGLPVPKPRADLGLSVAPLTDAARTAAKMLPQGTGVVVQAVAAGSEADCEHIAPGEVIQMVQNDRVTTPAEVQANIDRLRAKGVKMARVLVAGPDGGRWVAIRLQ
jgi:serine protease Do